MLAEAPIDLPDNESILMTMTNDSEQDGSPAASPAAATGTGSLATNALRALRAGRTDAPAKVDAPEDEPRADAVPEADSAVAEPDDAVEVGRDTIVADAPVAEPEPANETAVETDVDADAAPASTAEPGLADTEPAVGEPVDPHPVDTQPADPQRSAKKSTSAKSVTATATRTSTARRSGSAARTKPTRRRSPVTLVLATTAVLALVFAVIAGVLWWHAGHNSTRTRAAARDAVALDARLDIDAVNTSDYHEAPAALSKWLSVSTGTLHDQYAQSRSKAVSLLKQAKIVTSATVLDAAVTDLNTRKGTATVLASVDVRKQPVKGAAATQRNRFSAAMVRVGDSWKLDNLTLVSVQLS